MLVSIRKFNPFYCQNPLLAISAPPLGRVSAGARELEPPPPALGPLRVPSSGASNRPPKASQRPLPVASQLYLGPQIQVGQCSVLLVSLSCPTVCLQAFKLLIIGRIKMN